MKRLSVLVLVAALTFVGCSKDVGQGTAPTGFRSLSLSAQFENVTADNLISATLHVYVYEASGRKINIYRTTAAWDEATVTWNTFGGAYDNATVVGSFLADDIGWRTADLTDLVLATLNGGDNYGILLETADFNFPRTIISSSEYSSNNPMLEICYDGAGGPQCVQIKADHDTHIWANDPDANYGDWDNLRTGWLDDTYLQKKILIHFPLPEKASIGDFVWLDDNKDGIQDVNEVGYPGAEVRLYDCFDNYVGTTITDANGHYLFDNLVPGDYYVVFILPEGYVFSQDGQGADDAMDSDADPSTGVAACTTLDPGEHDPTWDAGLYLPEWEGCSLTIGFWKTHAGFGPQADVVTQFLPISLGTAGGSRSMNVNNVQIAYDILVMKTYGVPSNGITKLYAQMLAAKLNIANGASGSAVSSAISAADAWLANHSWTEWSSLGKNAQKQVLGWMTTFDNYNNGRIGPGHCDSFGDDNGN